MNLRYCHAHSGHSGGRRGSRWAQRQELDTLRGARTARRAAWWHLRVTRWEEHHREGSVVGVVVRWARIVSVMTSYIKYISPSVKRSCHFADNNILILTRCLINQLRWVAGRWRPGHGVLLSRGRRRVGMTVPSVLLLLRLRRPHLTLINTTLPPVAGWHVDGSVTRRRGVGIRRIRYLHLHALHVRTHQTHCEHLRDTEFG